MTDAVARLDEFSLSIDEPENVTLRASPDAGATADALDRIDGRMQRSRLQKSCVGRGRLDRPAARLGARARTDVEGPDKPDGPNVDGKFRIQAH
jgi:hypothetical protein